MRVLKTREPLALSERAAARGFQTSAIPLLYISGPLGAAKRAVDALPLRTDAGHIAVTIGSAQQIIAAFNGSASHRRIQLASGQTRFPSPIDQNLIVGIKAHL